ncbi:uncharacterized protein FYW61_005218 [Anableps anableps]
MAFANLFSGLSAMSEDAGSPGESDVTSSNRTASGSRGRKRKTQGEMPGSCKNRCHQFQSKDNFTSQNKPCQMQGTESERSSPGQSYNQSLNSNYNRRQNCNGQNYQAKHNFNVKKKKNKGKKKRENQHRDNRGARSTSQKQEKPKFMTQEFKDQNTLLVDGRLVCRHFLFGRCIKEDKCQLEHFQGYNDIIKEACKFYIKGFCMNGQSCPYMHKSFPCKFFHRKGNCLQEGNCRFSHEPLNDITEKLLEEAMEQEKSYYELAKTNKEESSEQQANTEETNSAEENKNPDFLTQPLRPSFYNSTDAEPEPHEHPDETEQRVLDADQPHSSPLNTQNQQEPVCYSVEAVLGPQLSRTFFSFSKTPVSQDSSSVSDPHASSDRPCTNPSKIPYSVEAVLSSYKSSDNSSNDQIPDPPGERAAFYTPQTISKQIQAPPFRKEKPPSTVVENRCQQTLPKSSSSPEEKNCLISDSPPVLSHTSEEELEGQKTCTKQELLHRPEKCASSRSRAVKDLLAGTKHNEISTGQVRPPKHPTQPKPSLSKGGVAVPDEPVATCNKRRDAADVPVHHFQPSEILPNFKKKHSDAQTATPEHHSNTFIKSCSETVNQGAFSAKGNQTLKRPFSSLFASPLTDSVTPGSDSLTAARKPQQSEDVRAPSLPFFSLFASPLSDSSPPFPCSKTQTAESAAPPCRQQLAGNAASTSKQKGSERRLHPFQVRTSHRQGSSESSQSSKTENAAVMQPSTAVCSTVSGSPCDLSSSRTNQNLPDLSSPRDTSSPSILKSLFVRLRPYAVDGEQKDSGQSRDQSEDEKERGVFLKKQQKNR